jgi:hypothetical protein
VIDSLKHVIIPDHVTELTLDSDIFKYYNPLVTPNIKRLNLQNQSWDITLIPETVEEVHFKEEPTDWSYSLYTPTKYFWNGIQLPTYQQMDERTSKKQRVV